MQAQAMNNAIASVLQSGRIDTSGTQAGDVHLLADGGHIKVDGRITANSTNPDAKGGQIVIGRDVDSGKLALSTDVSGAELESQKGFVETSGDWLTTANTQVKADQWLLDPYNVTISGSSSGTAYVDPGTTYVYTPTATSSIKAADVAASLNNGTSVTISTGAAGSTGGDVGDIAVNASITTSGSTNTALTLQAARNITFSSGSQITRSGTGKLDVTLNSNFSGANSGEANSGYIQMDSGSGITSNGGNITLGGGSAGDGSGNAVGNSGGGKSGVGIYLNNATLSSGAGNIVMNAKGDVNNGAGFVYGVIVDAASQVKTTGGNITINGTGGGAAGTYYLSLIHI